MKNSDVKRRALDLITNNWGQALAIVLLMSALWIAISLGQKTLLEFLMSRGVLAGRDISLFAGDKYVLLTSGMRLLLLIIILMPIKTGAVWWFLRFTRGEHNSIRSLFVCFTSSRTYLRTLAVQASVWGICLAAAIPVCGLIVLLRRLILYTMSRGTDNALLVMLIFCGSILTLCAICFYLHFMLKYALVSSIFVLNPDMPIREMLRMSSRNMKENRFRLIRLFLSFLWWVPSFILVFPLFFVAPYYVMAQTVLFNDILQAEFPVERRAVAGRFSSAMS